MGGSVHKATRDPRSACVYKKLSLSSALPRSHWGWGVGHRCFQSKGKCVPTWSVTSPHHPLQFWDQVSMKKEKCCSLVATESDRTRHETKPTVQTPRTTSSICFKCVKGAKKLHLLIHLHGCATAIPRDMDPDTKPSDGTGMAEGQVRTESSAGQMS